MLLLMSGKSAWLTNIFSETSSANKKQPVVPEALLGNGELQPDEVEFVKSDTGPAVRDYASMIDREGAAQMESSATTSANATDVPVKLTRSIRDDVIGVLSSETEAWFSTLRLAGKIPPQNNFPEGQFSLFMDSPQTCRGKAFTIRGRLRRLTREPLAASAETFGVRSVFDAWISTNDSGNQLVHVVAMTADPGLPLTVHTGKNPPDVEITGYFFKREGYGAKGKDGKGDLALTPLILAGRIQHLLPGVVVTRADEMNPWLTWIGIGVCCGVALIVWQFQASDKVFRETRTHQLTTLPVRPSFDGVESITIQQVLRDMQEDAKQNTPDTSLFT